MNLAKASEMEPALPNRTSARARCRRPMDAHSGSAVTSPTVIVTPAARSRSTIALMRSRRAAAARAASAAMPASPSRKP